ncbi:MAG TPA: carboxymuconolactone decarboxylase family protein [Caulobacteraceae bacterium]|jgi:4-carboxymuconolactone decarboxylase|nr:carboxymuconolactone decarboxylase family protein [Caulobacteraceae bacterium]
MSDDRFERGKALLSRMHGARGEAAMEALADLAPDLARLVAEHAFADLYARPGLDLKTRQFATVAALIAMGDSQPQLEVHMNAAMRLGWTQGELVELILQMSAYAGFPAAMKAVSALRAALAMRAEDEGGVKG